MMSPLCLLLTLTLTAAAPRPPPPPPPSPQTDTTLSLYTNCMDADISDIERLRSKLKETIYFNHTENIQKIPFGLLEEDWERLKFLEMMLPDGSPLKRKLVKAFRILVSAIYQAHITSDNTKKNGNEPGIRPSIPSSTTPSETAAGETDNEAEESELHQEILTFGNPPYTSDLYTTIIRDETTEFKQSDENGQKNKQISTKNPDYDLERGNQDIHSSELSKGHSSTIESVRIGDTSSENPKTFSETDELITEDNMDSKTNDEGEPVYTAESKEVTPISFEKENYEKEKETSTVDLISYSGIVNGETTITNNEKPLTTENQETNSLFKKEQSKSSYTSIIYDTGAMSGETTQSINISVQEESTERAIPSTVQFSVSAVIPFSKTTSPIYIASTIPSTVYPETEDVTIDETTIFSSSSEFPEFTTESNTHTSFPPSSVTYKDYNNRLVEDSDIDNRGPLDEAENRSGASVNFDMEQSSPKQNNAETSVGFLSTSTQEPRRDRTDSHSSTEPSPDTVTLYLSTAFPESKATSPLYIASSMPNEIYPKNLNESTTDKTTAYNNNNHFPTYATEPNPYTTLPLSSVTFTDYKGSSVDSEKQYTWSYDKSKNRSGASGNNDMEQFSPKQQYVVTSVGLESTSSYDIVHEPRLDGTDSNASTDPSPDNTQFSVSTYFPKIKATSLVHVVSTVLNSDYSKNAAEVTTDKTTIIIPNSQSTTFTTESNLHTTLPSSSVPDYNGSSFEDSEKESKVYYDEDETRSGEPGNINIDEYSTPKYPYAETSVGRDSKEIESSSSQNMVHKHGTESYPSSEMTTAKKLVELDLPSDEIKSSKHPDYPTLPSQSQGYKYIDNEINPFTSSPTDIISSVITKMNTRHDKSLQPTTSNPIDKNQDPIAPSGKTLNEMYNWFTLVFPETPKHTSPSPHLNKLMIYPRDRNRGFGIPSQGTRGPPSSRTDCRNKNTCVKVQDLRFYNPRKCIIYARPNSDFEAFMTTRNANLNHNDWEAENDLWSYKMVALRKKSLER